jgi:hypothetical protein
MSINQFFFFLHHTKVSGLNPFKLVYNLCIENYFLFLNLCFVFVV